MTPSASRGTVGLIGESGSGFDASVDMAPEITSAGYGGSMAAESTGQGEFAPIAWFDAACETSSGPDALEALAYDGVICLRQAFGQPWLDVIEAGIDEALGGALEQTSATSALAKGAATNCGGGLT